VVFVIVELTVVGVGEVVTGVGVVSSPLTSNVVSCSGVGLSNSESKVGVFDADDNGMESILSGIQVIA
jgi:hypothetical protein